MTAEPTAPTRPTVPSAYPETIEIRQVRVSDPAAAPLLAGLDLEYRTRYGPNDELGRYPDAEFAPPGGAFLILVERGRTVAGGAFRRLDAVTAELKRIWTDSGQRRRGLGRLVVRALEEEAARQGYRRVYLTTGPRQPEAAGLYLRAGYRPLHDLSVPVETLHHLVFEKDLPARGGRGQDVRAPEVQDA
ncbi:GNAT family N-acetyltransferase [Sphaerisporangium album]|uniref:GNAT family N-acetyltransferase n=1 Tax=Sphaerisporangium album TaxID=509200 RepID=A0A367FTU6_9ACTN|nr:GNAT family N-acetyltransferase [Sphaerisporangium album]RCG33025.1 GNAT family N-acetyltransferase [Sphaerisporangium album]